MGLSRCGGILAEENILQLSGIESRTVLSMRRSSTDYAIRARECKRKRLQIGQIVQNEHSRCTLDMAQSLAQVAN
jgi:hypothetical protein